MLENTVWDALPFLGNGTLTRLEETNENENNSMTKKK
jgi:hypothetical protein